MNTPTDNAWLDELFQIFEYEDIDTSYIAVQFVSKNNRVWIKRSEWEAKRAAILTHIDTVCRESWTDGYHKGWNAYNEAPYNPNKDTE